MGGLRHCFNRMISIVLTPVLMVYTTHKNGDDLGMVQMALFEPHYPLVNVYKKLWKDPPFFLGKSTSSMENHHF